MMGEGDDVVEILRTRRIGRALRFNQAQTCPPRKPTGLIPVCMPSLYGH
jgi:hypothetical protein